MNRLSLISLVPARWFPARRLAYPVAFMLVASVVLGGATRGGYLHDALLQFLAIPVLGIVLWRFLEVPVGEGPRGLLVPCLLIVLLPVLQLFPLPPWIWTSLPGRAAEVESLSMQGDLPWMPISMSPAATWLSLLSLLPALAVFLGVSQLGFGDRRRLSVLVLGLGVASVFIGLTQVAQGPGSSLRFFGTTNTTDAVGFFANRNHFAALLYVLVPLAAVWAVDSSLSLSRRLRRKRLDTTGILWLLVGVTVLVVLVAGQVMARSRAGIGLAILALIAAFALALTDRRATSVITPTRMLLGVTVLASLLMTQFALWRALERFAIDPVADARVIFARNTVTAAWDHMPFGSGIGTFVPVYAGYEKPEDAIANVYANHAHNDYLEAWLEGGVPGLLLVALCLAWLVVRVLGVWRRNSMYAHGIDLAFARGAGISVLLLVLHSIVDYPLRTSAMMAVAAFCCAMLVRPPAQSEEPEPEREVRMSRRAATRTAMRPMTPASAGGPAWPAEAMEPGIGHGATRRPGERWGSQMAWPEEWSKPAGDAPKRGSPPPRPGKRSE